MDTQGFRINRPFMLWTVVASATGCLGMAAVLTAWLSGLGGGALVAVGTVAAVMLPTGFYAGSTWGVNAARHAYRAGVTVGRLTAAQHDPAFAAVRHAAHIGAARAGVIAPDEVEPCGGPSCVFCRERDSQPVMDTPDAPTGPSRPFLGAVEVTLTPHGPVQRTYDEAGRITDSKMYRPGPWADRDGMARTWPSGEYADPGVRPTGQHDGYGRPVAADDTPTSSGGCDDGGSQPSGHSE